MNRLNDAIKVRVEVFVHEQGVPLELEIDIYEDVAEHVVIYRDGEPVAAGRVRIIDNTAKLERICVLKEYRRSGLGSEVVRQLEEIARKMGIRKARLNAQAQAVPFYEALGYTVSSDEFLEVNIPHVLMLKNL